MFVWLIILIAIVFLGISGLEDLKTREVPDYVSYAFIATAILIRFVWFLFEKDISILMWMPVSLLVIGGFSYLMYISGQWGGGDVKVLIGVSLLLSSFQGEVIPFFLSFLLNTLLVGAFYGVVGIGFMAFKNSKKIKWNIYEKMLLPITIAVAVIFVYFMPAVFAFLGVFILLSVISLVYFKKVEKFGMQVLVPTSKVTEGDWLVDDVKLNKKVFLKKRNIGLTIEDIKKLQKNHNIKKVKIKVGIPFTPVFLIAAIVTFVLGNVLLRLLLI